MGERGGEPKSISPAVAVEMGVSIELYAFGQGQKQIGIGIPPQREFPSVAEAKEQTLPHPPDVRQLEGKTPVSDVGADGYLGHESMEAPWGDNPAELNDVVPEGVYAVSNGGESRATLQTEPITLDRRRGHGIAFGKGEKSSHQLWAHRAWEAMA